jgi:transcriptional regulator with GAF, ATPase, and Fis domain
MDTSVKLESENIHEDVLKRILLSLSHSIASIRNKLDLLHVIQNSLRSELECNDIGILKYDLDKQTFEFFLETFDLSKLLLDPGSTGMVEFPIAGSFQEVVVRSEHSVFSHVDDLDKRGILRKHFLEKGGKWIAAMRLVYNDKIIGSIDLLSMREEPFSPCVLQTLESVSSYIAIAMANVIYHEELIERNNANEILLSTGEAFSHIRMKEDLLPVLKQQLERFSFYNDVLIAKVDEDGKTYSPYITQKESARTRHKDYIAKRSSHYAFPDGMFELALYADMPVPYDLEEIMKSGSAPVNVQWLYETGARAMVCISLKDKDKPIGVLFLLSDQIISFTPFQLRLAQGIGNQLASAVATILAQENIMEREAEKSLLLEFSGKMATARNRKSLGFVIKSYLKEIFHIREYIITLPNEDNLTYGYFVYDSFTEDANFNAIANKTMSMEKGMRACMASPEPIVFNVQEILQDHGYHSRSFWEAAGAEFIRGMQLRAADEVVGVLWSQPGTVNEDLFHGICAQVAIAISNILGQEKIQRNLAEIEGYRSKLERENQYLQEQIKDTYNYDEIIGANGGLSNIFQLVSSVAQSDSTVLLMGETGTGKELIATAIHNSSARRKNLIVKVNCAALPAQLVESELFGHEKGSFTGALNRRIGKFELANKGTLFLDEIGELSLEIQSKLLRALQEKEIERVGGNTVIKTDVRIIAASNRDLKNEADTGKFRRDLFYRLNVFPITLPALRDRTDDIPLLASYFMQKYAQKAGKRIKSISSKVVNELMRYEWPGNVRELEHLIERSVLMTTGDVISSIDLPKKELNQYSLDQKSLQSLDDYERAYILSVLKKTNGKIKGEGGAAEILDMPPTTLHSKMKKLGIRKFQ